MKKSFVFFVMVLALLFAAESSFAGAICVVDNFGFFWELKGGKVDKKTFTAKYFTPSGDFMCAGLADATQTNSGSLIVSLFNAHDTVQACQSVMYSLSTNIFFAGSGEYDVLGNGSVDGSYSISPVSCSVLSSAVRSKTDSKKNMVDVNPPSIIPQSETKNEQE